MTEDLKSVEFKQKLDGSWQVLHTPSGKVTHGLDKEEAEQSMKDLLGMDKDGGFSVCMVEEIKEVMKLRNVSI